MQDIDVQSEFKNCVVTLEADYFGVASQSRCL